MFDLENEIRKWRKALRKSRHLEDSDIAELESHLKAASRQTIELSWLSPCSLFPSSHGGTRILFQFRRHVAVGPRIVGRRDLLGSGRFAGSHLAD